MKKTRIKLLIPIHSFVDLITNSSTEIYVSATDQTVKAVNSLIQNMLSIADTSLKASDVFEVSLQAIVQDPKTYEETLTPISSADEAKDNKISRELSIVVKEPYTNNEAAKKVAKTLADLSSTFIIEEQYE